MPNERVSLATGMQRLPVNTTPLTVVKRGKLVTDPEIDMDIPGDRWFRESVRVVQRDGYVLAVTAALSMCLVTGRVDLVVAGFFGAGKTRAAAILKPYCGSHHR